MKGLEIIKHKARHTDERGDTFGYVSENKFGEIMIVRRKKGSVAGNHYHTGSDPTRNPEIQFILSGKVQFVAKNLTTKEEGTFIIEPNTEIKISPMVFHKMEMLEDTTFLEFHTEVSSFQDVKRLEE